MMGKELMAMTQGIVLSSLFARAISMAPADQGLVKKTEGFGAAGVPVMTGGTILLSSTLKTVLEIKGDENERR